MSAIDDIAAERRRQIEVEGFSAVYDDVYTEGELPAAAACYATGRVRYHDSLGPTEYRTLCYVSEDVAREIVNAGGAIWLFGEPAGAPDGR